MLTLRGKAVSPGVARGRAILYTAEVLRPVAAMEPGKGRGRRDQGERIRSAISGVHKDLETDARHMATMLGRHSGEIFRAQSALMHDSSVIGELERFLGRGPIDAEEAVRAVFAIIAQRFRESPSAALRARSDDADDLSRRLLLTLRGIHANRLEKLPPGTVLVARHLFPSDTVFLSRSSTVAVLAGFAGPAGHAALLARELGIPCVGGIPQLMERIRDGDDLIVDGDQGLALVSPDSSSVQGYASAIRKVEADRHHPARFDWQTTVTADGIDVAVLANAWGLEDVELAIRNGADGIGLFRTEPFFMASKHLPSAEEFAAFLARSLEPAGKKRVNVRLLDVGADKNPSYLPLPPEPDPFLGLRGVRVLLRHPALLAAQLRALLVSSQRFDLGILIPMVTLESDAAEVVAACRKIARTMGISAIPPIGAMVETPAAALTIPALAKHVDFFSLGSNDLTQYTLAAGRENPSVTDYFIDSHPAVLRLVELAVTEAGSVPISMCGELASRLEAIPGLLRIGLRSLSVPSSLLAQVRQAIRAIRVEDLRRSPEPVVPADGSGPLAPSPDHETPSRLAVAQND